MAIDAVSSDFFVSFANDALEEEKPDLPLANELQKILIKTGYLISSVTRWTVRQVTHLIFSPISEEKYMQEVAAKVRTAAMVFFILPVAFFGFFLSAPFYVAASYAGTGRFEKIEAVTPGLTAPDGSLHVAFQNICGQNPWSPLSGGVLSPLEEGPDGNSRADAIIAQILRERPDVYCGQEFDDLATSEKIALALSKEGYTCVRDLGCHSSILNHSGLFLAVSPEAANSIAFHPFESQDTTGITGWCDRGVLEVTVPMQNGKAIKILNVHLNAGGENHQKSRLLQLQKYIAPLMKGQPTLVVGDSNLDTSLLSPSDKEKSGLTGLINGLEGEVTCTDQGKHDLLGKPKENCADCAEKIDIALYHPEKLSLSDIKIIPGHSDHHFISLTAATV